MRLVLKNPLVVLLLSLGILGFLQYCIQIEFLYISDSLLKLIQAESLRLQSFKSESILYPSMDLDPNREAFSHPNGYARLVGKIMLGTYPIAFSFFLGILREIGIPYVPLVWVCASFLLMALYLLNRELKIKTWEFLWFFFFSMLFPLGFDCSEYGIFFFLQTLGFLAYLRFWKLGYLRYLFWFGFFTSLATWFRLESVFLGIACIISFALFPKGKARSAKTVALQILVLMLSVLPIFLFFLRNYIAYGAALGPRVLFSYIGSEFSFLEITKRTLSISFFYWNTSPKIGFFLSCAPLFLVFTIGLKLWIQEKTHPFLKNLTAISLLNLLFVSITAPNDGITIHGRYHILSLLPIISLVSLKRIERLYTSFRRIRPFLISTALILNLVAFLVFVQSSKQARITQNFYRENISDVLLFDHDFFCQMAGLMHLDNKILCIHANTKIEPILESLGNHNEIRSIRWFSFQPNAKNKDFAQLTMAQENKIEEGLKAYFNKQGEGTNWKEIRISNWER